MKHAKKERDLIRGPLFPNLIFFSLPVMFSGILQLFYTAADMAVVGQFAENKAQALGAIGCCGPIFNITVNLFIGLSVGAGVLTAFHFGAKDEKSLCETVHTAILTALIGGILLGTLGFCIASPMHRLLHTPDELYSLAVLYLKICFCGVPGVIVYNFGSSMLRALGDTKRPFWILTISGVINIALNLLLVIRFSLGVVGVGISTITAQYLSAMLAVVSLCRRKDSARLTLRGLRLHKAHLIRMMKIGIPAGIQSSVFSVSNIIIQSAVNSFGPETVAGNAAGSNIDGFVYVATNSMYHAALTFVGQMRGAGETKRIKKVMAIASAYAVVIALTVGFSVYMSGRFLMGVFAPGQPEVIAAGMMRLSIIATTYALMGLLDVSIGVLRGLGISLIPMCISITGICGTRITWIYAVFPRHHELRWLYFSYPLSWGITAAVMMTYAGISIYRLNRKHRDQDRKTSQVFRST